MKAPRYVGKYIVWVGGVDDHYEDKQEAEDALAEWIAQGYDDVQLETREVDMDAVNEWFDSVPVIKL